VATDLLVVMAHLRPWAVTHRHGVAGLLSLLQGETQRCSLAPAGAETRASDPPLTRCRFTGRRHLLFAGCKQRVDRTAVATLQGC
jgi:hypothetical protein